MQYTDLWPLIQQDILAVLQADAFLANIPGVAIQPGSTGSVVAAAIDKARAASDVPADAVTDKAGP